MKIRHVLTAVDFSKLSALALRTASSLAATLEAQLSACFVRELLNETQARARLDAFIAEQIQDPKQRPEAHVLEGGRSHAIVEWAKENDVDLIVCGTHGHTGLDRLLLGSFAEKTVRMSACPVWVVRGTRPGPEPTKILLPTDFAMSNLPARVLAAFLAATFGAELGVLHVHTAATAPSDDLEAFANETLREARSFGGTQVKVTRSAELGDPAKRINEIAGGEGYDLVVCGTRSRTGLQRWLEGSVAEQVVRGAPCSVLIVPGSGD